MCTDCNNDTTPARLRVLAYEADLPGYGYFKRGAVVEVPKHLALALATNAPTRFEIVEDVDEEELNG